MSCVKYVDEKELLLDIERVTGRIHLKISDFNLSTTKLYENAHREVFFMDEYNMWVSVERIVKFYV